MTSACPNCTWRAARPADAPYAPSPKPAAPSPAEVGALLDEMINARYHNGGSATAASARWHRVNEMADRIADALGSSEHSPCRARWEERERVRLERREG